MARPSVPLDVRFWASVEKTEGCWRWRGTITGPGYGQTSVWENGKQTLLYAHRVSYEMHYGPIPVGLFVCHSCDNKLCVRPDHLWLGTAADNTRDAQLKGIIPTRKPKVLKGRNPRRGERHPLAKLTEADVREIRVSYVEGHGSMSELAALYGVDIANIHRIIHRKIWAHVSDTPSGKVA